MTHITFALLISFAIPGEPDDFKEISRWRTYAKCVEVGNIGMTQMWYYDIDAKYKCEAVR